MSADYSGGKVNCLNLNNSENTKQRLPRVQFLHDVETVYLPNARALLWDSICTGCCADISLKHIDISRRACSDPTGLRRSEKGEQSESDPATDKIKVKREHARGVEVETGGKEVGSARLCVTSALDSACSLRNLFITNRGRGETPNLTSRLAPSKRSCLSHPSSALLLLSQYISGSPTPTPQACPLSFSPSLYFYLCLPPLMSTFLSRLITFKPSTGVVRNSSFLRTLIGYW